MVPRLETIFSRLIVNLVILMLICAPLIIKSGFVYPTQDGQLFFILYCGTFLFLVIGVLFTFFKAQRSFIIRHLDIVVAVIIGYVAIRMAWQSSTTFLSFYYSFVLSTIYIVVRNSSSHGTKYYFLQAILIATFLESLFGIFQLSGLVKTQNLNFAVTGSFFNPGPFAGYIITAIPISVSIILFSDQITDHSIRKTLKNLSWLNLFSISVILPASNSRSAWVAVLVSVIYLLVRKYGFNLISRYSKLCIYATTFLTITFLLLCLFNYKRDSANGRLLIWKITSQMIQNKPFLGYGPDQFKTEYMKFQADYFTFSGTLNEKHISDNIEYVYNEFLHITVEYGFLGLGLTLISIYISFKSNGKKILNELSRSSLLLFLIFTSLTYSTEVWPIQLSVVFIFAVNAECTKSVKTIKIDWSNLSFKIRVSFLIGTLGISILCFRMLKKQKEANFKWNQALIEYYSDNLEQSLVLFKDSYPALSSNGQFLSNYGKVLNMRGYYRQSNQIINRALNFQCSSIDYLTLGDNYESLRMYDAAKDCYDLASKMTPSKLYPIYLLAKLSQSIGDTVQMIKYARLAKEKEVKIKSSATTQMKDEMINLLRAVNK